MKVNEDFFFVNTFSTAILFSRKYPMLVSVIVFLYNFLTTVKILPLSGNLIKNNGFLHLVFQKKLQLGNS